MPEEACCDMMQRQLELTCVDHPNVDDCPDKLVSRWRSGSYVILIHDGGTSGVEINFCPWCGRSLSTGT